MLMLNWFRKASLMLIVKVCYKIIGFNHAFKSARANASCLVIYKPGEQGKVINIVIATVHIAATKSHRTARCELVAQEPSL